VRKGATLGDKAEGLLRFAMAPIDKYGSLLTKPERAYARSMDIMGSSLAVSLVALSYMIYTLARVGDAGGIAPADAK
jgi:hypothetical protein